ncbi:MAG: hypothetical protein NVSMB44_26030 [Ktedonobacteraceae bacterium]
MVKSYYTEARAKSYDRIWQTFSQKTLAATLSLLDPALVQAEAELRERPVRILDAGCGTGLLLAQLVQLLPQAELYGVDASQPMLAQTAQRLGGLSRLHLQQAALGPGETAGLPFAPAFFDIITFSNALHYISDPVATLHGLRHLLTPVGQIVLEDYTLHGPTRLWRVQEWIIKRYDPRHQRVYTIAQARALCEQAGLAVTRAETFPVNFVFSGWALRLVRA